MHAKLLTVALVAGPLLWAPAAKADLINMGASPDTITFTGNGNGTLDFSTTTFNLTGANFQSPTGNITLTGTATLAVNAGTTGAESGGIFPIVSGGTGTFSFDDGAGDTMAGNLTWAGIKDGTSSPQFDDNTLLNVTSVTGTNVAFRHDIFVGLQAPIDFTVNFGDNKTLTNLAAGSTSDTATFSSGEVVVPAPPIGHGLPVALAVGGLLFGAGLLQRNKKGGARAPAGAAA